MPFDGNETVPVVEHGGMTAAKTLDARIPRMAKVPLLGRDALDAVAGAPRNVVAEVLAGELHTSPRPRLRHANASSVLGGRLNHAFHDGEGGPGGWFILDEPELHLGDGPDICVPDIAGWRRERMPRLPDSDAIAVAPDWICEVLSPSTERIDRGRKRDIYARDGVSHLWFLAPDIEALEAFALEGAGYRVLGTWTGDDVARVPPFEALELRLEGLWLR